MAAELFAVESVQAICIYSRPDPNMRASLLIYKPMQFAVMPHLVPCTCLSMPLHCSALLCTCRYPAVSAIGIFLLPVRSSCRQLLVLLPLPLPLLLQPLLLSLLLLMTSEAKLVCLI